MVPLETDLTGVRMKNGWNPRKGEFSWTDDCISSYKCLEGNVNFHGGFTEVFTDVGVTRVAKMQYVVSPLKNECENIINL